MGKKKKKAKKQRFISGIIRDGKVTKKEAKQARKKGISLARINKARTKSFIPNNVFSNARVSREPSRMAPTQFKAGTTLPRRYSNNIARSYQQEHGGLGTYSPLVIKGSAQKVFDKPPKQVPTNTGQTDTGTTDTGTVDTGNQVVEEVVDTGPSIEDMFAETVAGMQAAYEQSLAQQQQQFAAMEAQQQQQMVALQQQMQLQQNAMSAASQLAGRPSVLGVQNAVSSAGTPRQIAALGASGSFGRGGMRIQSLNI